MHNRYREPRRPSRRQSFARRDPAFFYPDPASARWRGEQWDDEGNERYQPQADDAGWQSRPYPSEGPFEDESDFRRRAEGEIWPEDEYYINRRHMQEEENPFRRAWQKVRGEWEEATGRPGRYGGTFPEDRSETRYGEADRSGYRRFRRHR